LQKQSLLEKWIGNLKMLPVESLRKLLLFVNWTKLLIVSWKRLLIENWKMLVMLESLKMQAVEN